MNNRILTALFALALCLCLFIGVVPAEADAAHTHMADSVWHTESGDAYHWHLCATCTSTDRLNPERHNLSKPTIIVAPDMESTDTHHKVTCSKCDYVAYYTHTWYLPETTDTTHTYTCRDCGKVVTAAHYDENDDCVCDLCKYEIPHDFSAYDQNTTHHHAKCKVCGDQAPGEDVEHTFTWETTADTHIGTCSVCEYKQTAADHDFKYVDNKDGTHTRTCETCGYSDTVDHVDGKTKDCKCAYCDAQMEHTYEGWQENETVHSHYCTVCKQYVDEGKHEFEYTAAPYGTDTHKKICKVCGRVETTAACVDKDDDHYCDDCGGLRAHDEKASWMITHHKTMTCEEDGIWLHYECPTCHELFRNGKVVTGQDMTNPAKGHDLVWATAQETGHYQYCKDCNYHTDEEEHTFTYEYNNNGTHDKICSVCGREDPEERCSAAENCTCLCGHVMNHTASQKKMVPTAAVAPDCENAGNHAYYTCTDCGRIFIWHDGNNVYKLSDVGDPYVAPLGHDWVHKEDTLSGKHIVKCRTCKVSESIPHTSSTGGCTCDLQLTTGGICGKLVHSHDAVKVARKAPTCQEEGYEAYWKYEACGRMFKDDFARTEIQAPIAIAKVDHEPGEWVNEGDEHVKYCEVCDEELESGNHEDANGDNRCDVCNFELALDYVAEVPATCTTSGTKAHYISRVTQRKYWDAEGTKYISNTGDLVIRAYAHVDPVTGVGPIATDKGNGTHEYTCALCNNVTRTEAHTTGGCFCTVCGAGASAEHVATVYPYQAPVCDKDGHEAYAQCSCGQYYNAAGEKVSGYSAVSIKATGHKWGAEVFNDDAAGKHYAVCEICNAKNYGEHKVTASDPLSGNYHQFVCECGEVSLEAHYDKNGDNVCDEAGCKRDLSDKEVTVNNNPSTTVVTGDKNTVNTAWSWLRNWLNNTVGSNAGGSTTPTQTAQPGTATGSQGSTTGNNGTTNTPTTGSNTGSTGAGSNAGSSTQGGNQTANATGVLQAIIGFFNWILSGFGG